MQGYHQLRTVGKKQADGGNARRARASHPSQVRKLHTADGQDWHSSLTNGGPKARQAGKIVSLGLRRCGEDGAKHEVVSGGVSGALGRMD